MTQTVEPWHLTASECARWLGIARNTFSDRGYTPAIQEGRKKLFDIRDVVAANARAGIVPGADAQADIDLQYEKARLTKAQADLAEMNVFVQQNALAPVELFGATFEDFAGQIVLALEGLPGDIRRAEPEIGARSLEVIERKIADFRNLAADLCVKLSGAVERSGS